MRTHEEGEAFTNATRRYVLPRLAPTSLAVALRSVGAHGRTSVGRGSGVGATYSAAGRSTHGTTAPGDRDAVGTMDAAGLVGATLAAEDD
jgi:hypothetical protein